jgi:hypothetical protein
MDEWVSSPIDGVSRRQSIVLQYSTIYLLGFMGLA